MQWLIGVSILWSFSFGTIKSLLTGLDPNIVATLRLALGLIVVIFFAGYASLFRQHAHTHSTQTIFLNDQRRRIQSYIAIGAIQFGLMYLLYIRAYQYLDAAEVALMTVTTPIWIFFFSLKKLRDVRRALMSLTCVLIGSFMLRLPADGFSLSADAYRGLGLMTAANMCFAIGQVWHKAMGPTTFRHHSRNYIFGFLGATVMAAILTFFLSHAPFEALNAITSTQWLALIYLGSVASGLGFLLWNYGASQVTHAQLALMNNFKIPVAVVVTAIIAKEWAAVLSLNFLSASILFVIAFLLIRQPTASTDLSAL